MENVVEAYNFLVNNYSPGDHLFFLYVFRLSYWRLYGIILTIISGFSRGAYTARSAAGLVSEIGVVKPAYMGKFLELYTIYTQTVKAKRTKQFSEDPGWLSFTKATTDYATTNAADIVIQVIGVFDTVGALGVPDIAGQDMSAIKDAYEFLNVELNDSEFPFSIFLVRLPLCPQCQHC